MNERTPRALARFWATRALGPDPDVLTIEALTELLAQGRQADSELPEPLLRDRLPAAVALAFMSPGFQWR